MRFLSLFFVLFLLCGCQHPKPDGKVEKVAQMNKHHMELFNDIFQDYEQYSTAEIDN